MNTTRICGHTFLHRPLGPHSVVVDLGMNRGEFSTAMIERFGCRVWGAEPDPRLFAEIPERPGLTKLPLAVGGQDGEVSFNLNGTVCSSVLFAESDAAAAASVTVPMLSLASFLRRNGLDRVDLMKIDIEGAELEMFDRASDELLRRIDQISIEFHQFMDRDMAPHVSRIRQRLRAMSFASHDFSTDCYDVLFVNTARLPLNAADAVSFTTAKYARGLARRVRHWAGRPEPASWTVAEDLRTRGRNNDPDTRG